MLVMMDDCHSNALLQVFSVKKNGVIPPMKIEIRFTTDADTKDSMKVDGIVKVVCGNLLRFDKSIS
jgi:hypothetical protein